MPQPRELCQEVHLPERKEAKAEGERCCPPRRQARAIKEATAATGTTDAVIGTWDDYATGASTDALAATNATTSLAIASYWWASTPVTTSEPVGGPTATKLASTNHAKCLAAQPAVGCAKWTPLGLAAAAAASATTVPTAANNCWPLAAEWIATIVGHVAADAG